MAEPGDGGVMRVSDADRERTIDRLRTAFADGMLSKDEFETRVGLTLTSRTRADLAAVTADIPAESARTSLPVTRDRRRNPSVKTGAAIIAVPILAGGILAGLHDGTLAAAFFIVVSLLVVGIPIAIVVAIVRAILLAEARQARRGSGSLPPSPGTQPARRRPGTRPDGQSGGPNSLAIGLS